jgi:cell division protein FtsX
VPRLKWFTWIGLLGAGIASWGLVWLAISSQVAKHASRLEWLTSGLDESIAVRITGLMAAVFLAVVASDWLMRILDRNP